MNNFVRRCVAALFLALLAFFTAEQASSAEAWQQVGAAGFSAGQADNVSMATDSNGVPYVAYRDGSCGNKASVMKFDGLKWIQVGSACFTAAVGAVTEVSEVSIALNASNVPYVAYKRPSTGEAMVMKFTGAGATGWAQVGLPRFSEGAVNGIRMAVDGAGVPYVAYQDIVWGNQANVMKYDGSAWTAVGSPEGITAGQADGINLAFDSTNVPHLAYRDEANGWRGSVMKFEGGSWAQVGAAGFTPGEAHAISFTIGSDNVPYMAYRDMVTYSGRLSVMKFESGAWTQVGLPEFTVDSVDYISIVIGSGGVPYVAYRKSNVWPYQGSVMKYDSGTSSWVLVGNADFTSGWADYLGLAIDKYGTPYVAYRDNNAGNKASVLVFANQKPAPWQQVGQAEFTPSTVDNVSMALDSNSIPYVAYKDGSCGNKASVMKFTGAGATGWEQVGIPCFTATVGASTTDVGEVSLALDSADVPYVAYKRPSTGEAMVMKFNGASWVQVGLPRFSDGAVNGIQIAIDGTIPYVAYQDTVWGNKANVMKYEGGAWAAVGSAEGITLGQAEVSLAINGSGTPYVAYRDYSDPNYSYKASVIKFTGAGVTGWEQVGSAEFSPGYANNIKLAIDSSGTPYVAYQDYSDPNYSSKASVMKFTGAGATGWEQVGNAEFTPGEAGYLDLAIDSSGTPYVAYRDYSAPNYSYKASVMKFNGTEWKQVGNAEFTAGNANYISLAINSSGIPYVAYQDYSWPNYSYKASVMKFVPNPCGTGRALPIKTWLMTAPSCQPAPFAWINSQHGDDLGDTYNTRWKFFKWDSGAYVPQTETDRLVPGVGNWSYSLDAGTLQLEGVATPTVDCTAYGLAGQCFAIDLPLPAAGQSAWALAGHPFSFPVAWASVKIAVQTSAGGTWTAYSPSAAETAGYVRKIYQTWNGNTYVSYDDSTVGMIGTLQSQEAFWVRIMPGASALTGLKLLIPVSAP